MCGLKVRVGCQDRFCVNSDADEILAMGKQIYEEVLPYSCEKNQRWSEIPAEISPDLRKRPFFWSSPKFGGKISKFRTKIQTNFNEDLFDMELTRPFIWRALIKLLEETLVVIAVGEVFKLRKRPFLLFVFLVFNRIREQNPRQIAVQTLFFFCFCRIWMHNPACC